MPDLLLTLAVVLSPAPDSFLVWGTHETLLLEFQNAQNECIRFRELYDIYGNEEFLQDSEQWKYRQHFYDVLTDASFAWNRGDVFQASEVMRRFRDEIGETYFLTGWKP